MTTYIFSWYCTETHPVLIERPWWKVWSHDRLDLKSVQVRRHVILTEAEAEVVREGNPIDVALLKKLIGKDSHSWQLETETFVSEYVSTSEYVNDSLMGAR
jgi:hypothetical protein